MMKIPTLLVFTLFSVYMLSCNVLQNKPSERSGNEKRPNVIYIYADDLGYGELGSYGQEKIHTPNLDRLAAEGIRFTQHYTGTPVCAPARCMLLTGKHGGHSYIRGNYEMGGFSDDKEAGQMPLPANAYTIAHLFQDAGYATGAVGKWGLGMEMTTGAPLKQGFDYFYGYLDQKQAHNYFPTHLWERGKWDTLKNEYFLPHARISKGSDAYEFERFIGNEYAPDKMTEKALLFMENNKREPFFLYLPYTIPHVALQIPHEKAAYKMYENKFDVEPYLGNQGYTPAEKPLATYAAMITQLDAYVGRVMEKVEELGLDENTIIMFSSDNGPAFNGGVQIGFFNSTAGLRGAKMDLYEGGIREPFIARWPGHIAEGILSNHVSAQYDMMATFADLLDVAPPQNDGISLLPTLLGENENQKTHDFLYFEFPEKGGQVAVRLGDWKGIKTGLKKNPNARWQLYNLTTDRAETNDLSSQHLEILKKMDRIVEREHRPAHIREWEFIHPRFIKTHK